MPLTVTVNFKGSPGATQAAAGLAAAWPEADRVLVETDPSGGVLASRWRLMSKPGLLEMSTRSSTQPDEALDAGVQHVRLHGAKVPVVCAPARAAQAEASIAKLLPRAKVLSPQDRWVIADVGRIGPGALTWPLVERADMVVMVIAGTVEQMLALRGMVASMEAACGGRLGVVVAAAAYGAHEVNGVLTTMDANIPVLGELSGPVEPERKPSNSDRSSWESLARSVIGHATQSPPTSVGQALEGAAEEIEGEPS